MKSKEQPLYKGLSAAELKETELKWLKLMQRQAFYTEYRDLLSSKNVVYNCQLILFLETITQNI